MTQQIVTIEGHPDTSTQRLNHALAQEYRSSARAAGHDVRRVQVASLDVPILRSADAFFKDTADGDIARAQRDIAWANQLTIFYPMWHGGMPALFRAFIEQMFRPSFRPKASAHFIVTMDAPTAVHRLYLRTFLKHLHRNVLQFSDVGPITETILGGVASAAPTTIHKWFARMREYGKAGR